MSPIQANECIAQSRIYQHRFAENYRTPAQTEDGDHKTMRHITLYVTDDLYHQARRCAARRDLSESVLVRKIFESLRDLPSIYYGHDDPYA